MPGRGAGKCPEMGLHPAGLRDRQETDVSAEVRVRAEWRGAAGGHAGPRTDVGLVPMATV